MDYGKKSKISFTVAGLIMYFFYCVFFVCLFDIIEKRSGVTIMMRLQAPLLSFSLWSYCGTFDWRYVFGTFPH